ncbi:BnaC07g13530D [Brassica napus]|uniref:BnaC07g13530D protein n=2 Tax=Brassica TaxID=3705 RepID=A0A078FK79_BRANA|nr:BnaC07g13530D [Brassica napus]VDD37064.1 unnamed protein product [Brassica oleracea]
MPIWQESCQRDIVILFLLKWKGAKKIWETRLTQRMITPLRALDIQIQQTLMQI